METMLVRLEGGFPSRLLAGYPALMTGRLGKVIGAASFLDNGIGVLKHLVHGHGIHFAAVVVAGLDSMLR